MEAYELRRGSYKNLTLRMDAAGRLKVSAPWYYPKILVDRFVSERSDWIARHRRAAPAAPPVLNSFSVWGVEHEVKTVSPGTYPRVLVDAAARTVTLRVPAGWPTEKHAALLEEWQKQAVRTALEELVPRWAQKMGLRVNRWTVKTLRSRWGSCRPDTGSLVFNSRLAALPLECLEHVVVHELVHLIELSHNKRFHALVEHWLPGSAAVRKLLKAASAGPGASPEPPATPGEETARSVPAR